MPPEIKAPLQLYEDIVQDDWIDYNGHLSEAFYVLVFGYTTDAFYDYVGMDAQYRTLTGCTVYTVEAHIHYLRELTRATPLKITTQLLGHDAKRLYLFHRMRHAEEEYLAATIELMLIHYNQTAGKVIPFPAKVHTHLAQIHTAHTDLPFPPQAGRRISL